MPSCLPRRSRRFFAAVGATVFALTAAALTSPATAQPEHRGPGQPVALVLPLGAADLPETRTTTTLQPGVTLTTIVRGGADTSDRWTVEVASPDTANPDPDAPGVAITPRADAQTTARKLQAAGLDPRVEAVRTPRTADTGGLLGYRVRVGSATTAAALAPTIAAVRAAGLGGGAVYTGWDADAGAAAVPRPLASAGADD